MIRFRKDGAAPAKKPRVRRPATAKKPKAPKKPSGKGVINSSSQTGARVSAAAAAATQRMLSHDLLSSGPDLPAAGSAWDRDYQASTRLGRAAQYLAARGKRTTGVYKMEAGMDYESGLMQAFAKNRYGVFSSKQRRMAGKQNRLGREMKTRPTAGEMATRVEPKNLAGATGSQAPNRVRMQNADGLRFARGKLKHELKSDDSWVRWGAKGRARAMLDRNYPGRVKKAIDAALIEKSGGTVARSGPFAINTSRLNSGFGGKAGRKYGRPFWGLPASKKQMRTYMTNRQHTADYRGDAGRTDGSTKAGRAMDQRIIGGKLRRAGSYSPMKKSLVERIDAEMIAKARYGLAGSSKQRNSSAVQRRLGGQIKDRVPGHFIPVEPKNLGGASGSQAPNAAARARAGYIAAWGPSVRWDVKAGPLGRREGLKTAREVLRRAKQMKSSKSTS